MILFESPAASVLQKNAVKLQKCFMDYYLTFHQHEWSGPYSLFITSQSVQPFVTAVKSKGGATTFYFTIANFHLK